MPSPIPDGTQANGTVSGKPSNGGTMFVVDGTNGTAIPIAAVSNLTASFYTNTGSPPQDGDVVLVPGVALGQRAGGQWHTIDGLTVADSAVPAPRILVVRNGNVFKS